MVLARVRLGTACALKNPFVMASELKTMRIASAAILLLSLPDCAAAGQTPAPALEVELPYSACEPMASLRSNLTGTPYPSARSDALLHELGVRCIGDGYPAVVRPRY
jgi:hypothetical protein